jgi:hypothetical protein
MVQPVTQLLLPLRREIAELGIVFERLALLRWSLVLMLPQPLASVTLLLGSLGVRRLLALAAPASPCLTGKSVAA